MVHLLHRHGYSLRQLVDAGVWGLVDRRLALALASDPSLPADAQPQSNLVPNDPPSVATISLWKLSMLYNALVKLRATKDHLTHPAQTSLAHLTHRALSSQSNGPSQSQSNGPSQSQSNGPSQTNDARAVSNVLYFVAKLRWPILTHSLLIAEPHDRQGLGKREKDGEGKSKGRDKSNNTERGNGKGRGGDCVVTKALVRWDVNV